jgi:molecular chaperone HtpG
MKAQALRDSSLSTYMSSRKTLEINPTNAIIRELRTRVAADKAEKTAKDLVNLLFDTAMLTSGFSLDEPNIFAARIHRMVRLGLSIDAGDEEDGKDAEAEEDDLPPLEEGPAGASEMEQVD